MALRIRAFANYYAVANDFTVDPPLRVSNHLLTIFVQDFTSDQSLAETKRNRGSLVIPKGTPLRDRVEFGTGFGKRGTLNTFQARME